MIKNIGNVGLLRQTLAPDIAISKKVVIVNSRYWNQKEPLFNQLK